MQIEILLNAKLQPMHRHEIEDTLDEIFQRRKIPAEITGGGTTQAKNGEIESCCLEIELQEKNFNTEIIDIIEFRLAPKGSKILIYQDKTNSERVLSIGKHEGLGLYFSNDLDQEIYEKYDINVAYEIINKLLEEKGAGRIESYWEGEKTAFYIYGENFDEIHEIIGSFLNEYPLCEKCKVVKIA